MVGRTKKKDAKGLVQGERSKNGLLAGSAGGWGSGKVAQERTGQLARRG